MKLHVKANLLVLVLFVCWLVPLQGKKLAPEFFGTAIVQWTSSVIVAICSPILVLIAFKLFSQPKRIRTAFWMIVMAWLPLLYAMVFYGIIGTMLARTNLILQRGHDRDSETIAILTDRALNEDTVASRAQAAGHLYGVFCIDPVWKNSENQLERYQPTLKQMEMWERTVDTNRMELQMTEMIDGQLKQMPWLFGLYLGSFTLIVFSGLAWQAYKTNSGQGAEGGSDCTPESK
jgi:hypothetical protein